MAAAMALEYKDYYATLGVPRTASDDEIKKAFRKLARQYHPDVAKDKKAAEERFKEINEAYEVLGSPENRRKYDRLGANWKGGAEFRPPPGWERRQHARGRRGEAESFEFHFGGTGFSDFFEAFFGGRSRGFPGGNVEAEPGFEAAIRGGDLENDILVALDEVLHGSVRTITLQTVHPRTGQVERSSFQVRIPPGVREGQLIRVSGKGEPGFGGAPSGDLYLRVRLAQHPDFRVRDQDLWTDIPVAPWEAVLGATVRIPTLEGAISLKIPPGSRNGQQLRVRGRGLPAGDRKGDLYGVITIEVPASISAEERALWEQLAAKSSFHPRREQ
jgi:curved DNA-binding protein